MGRKGKFKPLMVSRSTRAAFADEFFLRLNPAITRWQQGLITGPELTGIYWLQFMKLWRPRDYKSGRYYRSCPERAHRGFELWCAQPNRIVLSATIPLAAELLDRQCGGQRVLTLMLTPESFLQEVNGRDPLSFLLHDLIHAYEFFADPVQMLAQIQFYQRLRAEMQASEKLSLRLKQDSDFAAKFEYLIADMNSHPAHLEAYYQHILGAP
jgi:hypothetical protein